MNQIFQSLKKIPLVIQIIFGLVIGVILAAIAPESAKWITIFGDLFVKALKSVAPLLVLVLVTSAIASHKKDIKIGLKLLFILYFSATLIASIIAVICSFIYQVKLNLNIETITNTPTPKGVLEVLENIIRGAVSNPIQALIEANYIAILVWSIALGITFRKANEATKNVLKDLASVVTDIVKIIISFAPLGVMGLVFASCTDNGGFSNLVQYGKIIILLVSVMLIMTFIINPLFVFFVTKKNPYPLTFLSLKDSAYYAFFTRSSAANIPVNMALCDRMGVPRSLSALSIPLGATINMSGAAITVSILTISTVFTVSGSNIDLLSTMLLCFVSAICACGASGVAGGSLMLIPLACSLFGINNDIAMQVVAIGMVIGVIQDSCETALNSSTDALFTMAINEKNKQETVTMAINEMQG